MAYRLDLTRTSFKHHVFYVSVLKQAIPPSFSIKSLHPEVDEELEIQPKPSNLLDLRHSTIGNVEVLVR